MRHTWTTAGVAALAINVAGLTDVEATMELVDSGGGEEVGDVTLYVAGVDFLGQLDDGVYAASCVVNYQPWGSTAEWTGELSASRHWNDDGDYLTYSIIMTMDFGGLEAPFIGSTTFSLHEIEEPWEDPIYYSYGLPQWETTDFFGETTTFIGYAVYETTIPAPAGLGVLGLALLAGRRRRR
ncbi:MAG: hypothetical protein QF733_07790 [Phycisphaerales bacterium]|jgi:hypothetical protein|nr:hypothetical protein [Phycisphaerales bacterium]